MTTELTILLALAAFILMGAFVGPNSPPRKAFVESGPALGARVERQLDTGVGFQERATSIGALGWSGSKGDFE